MKNRPARAVDAAHDIGGQDNSRVLRARKVLRVRIDRARPAATETRDTPAPVEGLIDHRLDRRIQTGNVAASGQDS